VSSMDELVAFVRRCLDDDEYTADEWHRNDCRLISWGVAQGWCDCEAKKRVLAEVKAKRQVLEAMEDQAREHLNTICNDPEAEGRYVQRAEFYRQEVARLLAQPYAGQDGWREEWRT
jgi:hypothetical protein